MIWHRETGQGSSLIFHEERLTQRTRRHRAHPCETGPLMIRVFPPKADILRMLAAQTLEGAHF